MSVIVIAAGLLTLFVFPVVAYGVMWLMSRGTEMDRPEPPETNSPRRTIPGRDSSD